jgi:hypothetical protein
MISPEAEPAGVKMTEARQALDEYETANGYDGSTERVRLSKEFNRAATLYLKLSKSGYKSQ